MLLCYGVIEIVTHHVSRHGTAGPTAALPASLGRGETLFPAAGAAAKHQYKQTCRSYFST